MPTTSDVPMHHLMVRGTTVTSPVMGFTSI